jgi:hypothetical protein
MEQGVTLRIMCSKEYLYPVLLGICRCKKWRRNSSDSPTCPIIKRQLSVLNTPIKSSSLIIKIKIVNLVAAAVTLNLRQKRVDRSKPASKNRHYRVIF